MKQEFEHNRNRDFADRSQAVLLPGDAFFSSLDKGRETEFRAIGSSMLPLFPSGSIFLIEPINAEKLKKGDIVLLRLDKRVLLHRFIGWINENRQAILTKGDWLDRPDPPFPSSAVCGRATAFLKDGEFRSLSTVNFRSLSLLIAYLSPTAGIFLKLARNIREMIVN